MRMFVVPGLTRDFGVTSDAVVGDPGVRRDDVGRDDGGVCAVRMFVVPGLTRDLGVTPDAVVGDPGVRRDDMECRDDESAGLTGTGPTAG
ncbi:MAG: hypothetical protein KBG85_12525 [Micropruina sp.]|nr:hypothetical protein [Micropruina sp.]